jgi:hypothetical protein
VCRERHHANTNALPSRLLPKRIDVLAKEMNRGMQAVGLRKDAWPMIGFDSLAVGFGTVEGFAVAQQFAYDVGC